MNRIARLVVLALLLVTVPRALAQTLAPDGGGGASADEQRVEVGEHGTTVDLGENWNDSELDLGFEGDQFGGRGRHRLSFMGVIEQPTAFTGEYALAESAALAIEGIRGMADSLEELESWTVTEGERAIVLYSFEAEVMGQALLYAIAVTGQDGLRHIVMAWKPASRSGGQRLADETERVARSLVYPAPDSAWGRLLEPVEHTLAIGSSRITVGRRPALLDLQEDPGDALIGFVAPEYDLFVNFLPREDTADLELVLDDAFEVMRESAPDLELIDRFETVIGGRIALGAEIRSTEFYTSGGFLYAVQLDDASALDLRIVYEFEPQLDDFVHDDLLDSIVVESNASALSFLGRRTFEPELDAEQRAFLAACEVLGAAPSVYQNYFPVDDGWVAGHALGVDHLSDDFSTWFPLFEDDWVPSRSIGATARGRVITLSSAGEEVDIGGFDDAPRYDAVSGDEVLLTTVRGHTVQLERIRSATLASTHDFERPFGTLRLRMAGRSLWERHGTRARFLIGSRKDAVLVGIEAPIHTGAALEVLVVTVGASSASDGVAVSAGAWDLVTVTAAIDDGWLVTGTPRDDASGVYRVGFDGARELLVGGQTIEGIGVRDDGALLLSCGWRSDPQEQLYELLAVDPERCAVLGPACRDAGPAEIDRVARAVLDLEPFAPLLLESSEAVTALAARARERWTALLGVDAPTDGAGLEGLVFGPSGYRVHTRPGRALIALLIAEHALAHGGVLAGPLALGMHAEGGLSRTRWTDFGLSFDPIAYLERADLVPPTSPHVGPTWIQDRARGRTVVIGSSRAAVDAALDGLGDHATLARIEELPVDAAIALVEAHPDNRHLRDRIALRLAAVDRAGEGRAVLAAAPSVDGADREETVLVWTLAAEAGDPCDARIDGLLSALFETPNDLDLVLLLGQAFAERDGENDAMEARRCFGHVLDTTWAGDARDEERAYLAELALDALAR